MIKAQTKRFSMRRPVSTQQNRSPVSLKPVQQRLMIPLTIVILLLVGGFTYMLVSAEQNAIDLSIQQSISTVSMEFEQAIQLESQKLSLMQSVLLSEANLIEGLKSQDVDHLLQDYQATFKQLQSNFGVTHFYFEGPDRVNLLRLHSPDKYGDLINRYTTLEAERTGRLASGIELGRYGTFTLRVVQPVFEGDSLLGYIELGKEIEDILFEISKKYSVELALSIRKEFLSRQTWETGMSLLERAGNWDLSPDKVVSYSTLYPFPEQLGKFLTGDKHNHSRTGYEIKVDQKLCRMVHIPLFDASDTRVGDLLALHDITEARSKFARILILFLGVVLVLLTGLFLFLYLLLRQTDLGIIAQQADLHDSHAKYLGLFENSVAPILLLDRSGKILDYNQASQELLGYTGDELLDRVYPLDKSNAEKNQAFFDKLLSGSLVDNLEQRLVRKDGLILEVLNNSRPLANSDGRVDRFQSTLVDITERKKAERELIASNAKVLESETYLKSIINNIGDPIFVKDCESRLVVVNEAFCTLFGMDKGQVIGKTLAEDVTPAERESFLRIDRQVLSDGRENINEETLTLRGDRPRILSTRKTRYVNESGEKFLIGVIRDITDAKIAEAEIERSNTLRETLLDIITHDLKNPAGVIYALSEAALKSLPENKFIKSIYTTSDRLIEVLQHATTLSKAAFGEDIPKETLSLNDLIQKSSMEFDEALKAAEMNLEVAIAPQTIIQANPLIEEVFKNYIGNAIKYSRSRKIIIEAKSEAQHVTVCVKDFGQTISKVDRDQIFNRRVQLQNSSEQGRGLGLSIVKRIAEAHHGEVWVEPNVPQGNCFCLRIPR